MKRVILDAGPSLKRRDHAEAFSALQYQDMAFDSVVSSYVPDLERKGQ